jgi:hypothetical protein
MRKKPQLDMNRKERKDHKDLNLLSALFAFFVVKKSSVCFPFVSIRGIRVKNTGHSNAKA